MTLLFALFDDFYALPLPVFATLAGVFGLLLGSFLNVVILRLPIMMLRNEQLFILEYTQQVIPDDLQGRYTLYTPASHCPVCKASVRWWMNIPLVSYLLLKGRCAGCKTGISLQYPVVECLAAVLGVVVALFFDEMLGRGMSCAIMLLMWALLTLTVIDFNTQLLPDVIVLPLVWLGLIINIGGVFTPLSSAVWGAVAGYLSLWSVCYGYKLLTGKDGMGHGDFKLLAALGAWLGVGMVLPIIFFASVAGSIIGVFLIKTGRLSADKPFAFGPYLAIAGALCAFYGERIVNFYLAYARIPI
jgi:leader peptidase (prepilin peptidase) / N-methyltransferase